MPTGSPLLRERQDIGLTQLYVGVDGGQSSTTALIADETGAVVGRGAAGPCNHVTGAEATDKFNRVIGECVDQACGQAGIARSTTCFAAACLGFSGGPEDKRTLTEALLQSDRYHVTHDAEIALTGAMAGEPGIIVISGTGSMAFGRNADGKCARAGGWGYIFGDDGGAFDIVRQALRAALRFEEGWGARTSLSARLGEILGLTNANAILHAFYTPEYPRSKVASLARLVSEEAERGDGVAVRILRDAGEELTELVRAVADQLFGEDERFQIAAIGGTFSSAILRESLAEQVRIELHRSLTEPKMSPAAGALLQALRIGGNSAMPKGPGLADK